MKYLGIDFGLRKIGLAVSEGELASPWQILAVKGFSDAIEKTSQIIKEGNFEKIIIGLPEGKMGQVVKGFVNALKKNGIDVETADETLSSKKGLKAMIKAGIGVKNRRNEDAFSAAGILQDYLDSRDLPL
ncbi:MAG: hypothetical protein ACD_38C00165G0004 [uncultured bacterium]|uniref:Putative pre-16S rRNA nuclease n=1 Tax=Candidatus Daviesbacteria bacterium GW2011_GWC2_40_12 TaxID=1618431 RepID=A0A0G0TVZ2_9BACT|nr:MAG: hypothetical protein ACD_38C00165G0004 [uncultured bacterium]KKR17037.1 MAG: hypothetical protein UT45_C0003G0067 [Candidatus Daviesbacteria bacterium GW2011_GWA2_39_33]KKR24245.1 MAG: hypothetical protein UT54_C0025G0012 [Candidatus Daviesbacteria bacterium GW2011_GWB1_39_5]KKR42102.1 MAG: hypothetical protein UT77_C0004G0086 [Candidatus Daviesbacteria bacterium GW2011_GWC2_40_12]OGE20869.1 MAG: hypothetical protein A2778_06375 [Candidatus Daviesbacteria bacterium RIFCSPHIGHO2_01_FULL_